MKESELMKILIPLNHKYKELFGYIPCNTDYSCTQEEYISALEKAVKEKKEITAYVVKYNTINEL